MDGEEYYEYILIYVDDIIVISHKSREVMEDITSTFKFNNDKTSPPKTYLGAMLKETSITRKNCWMTRSVDYINTVVKNIKVSLKNNR